MFGYRRGWSGGWLRRLGGSSEGSGSKDLARGNLPKHFLSKYLQLYSRLVKWWKSAVEQSGVWNCRKMEASGFAMRNVDQNSLFLCAERKIAVSGRLRRLGSFCRFTLFFTETNPSEGIQVRVGCVCSESDGVNLSDNAEMRALEFSPGAHAGSFGMRSRIAIYPEAHGLQRDKRTVLRMRSAFWYFFLKSTLSFSSIKGVGWTGLTPSLALRAGTGLIFSGEFLGLGLGVVQCAHVHERGLGEVVAFAFDNSAEAVDGVLQRRVDARETGELLGDEESLAQESFHLSSPGDDQFVFFGQFIDAEDGDDVLQTLITLQDRLGLSRDIVVVLADDAGLEDTAGRCEGIDGRVDAFFGDGAGKDDERIKVTERGGRSRVGQVVCRDVNSLHRGDGAFFGRGNPFLQFAHRGRKSRLVTHGRGHAAQQGGYFRSGLGESENVIDKQEGFFTAGIAEVLTHGQAGQSDTKTGARRLVHLTEDHGHAVEHGTFDAFGIGELGFLHFQPEVVAFAGSFADACEDGISAVFACDTGDHFLDDDGLTDACSAEQADFAATDERAQQVDDLDACFEDFGLGVQICKRWRALVDGAIVIGFDRSAFIHGFTEQVKDASEHGFADRNLDRIAGISDFHAACHAVGGPECDGADLPSAEVLLDLAGQMLLFAFDVVFDGQGVVDSGEAVLFELSVKGGPDDLTYHTVTGHFEGPSKKNECGADDRARLGACQVGCSKGHGKASYLDPGPLGLLPSRDTDERAFGRAKWSGSIDPGVPVGRGIGRLNWKLIRAEYQIWAISVVYCAPEGTGFRARRKEASVMDSTTGPTTAPTTNTTTGTGPVAPSPAVAATSAVPGQPVTPVNIASGREEQVPAQPQVPAEQPTRLIALMNQKGGVGKTTSAVNLGAALAKLGKRVLMIDLDPQGHMSLHLGVDPDNLELSVYDLMTKDQVTSKQVAITVNDSIMVIPSEVNLAGVEAELAPKVVTGLAQRVLKSKVDPLLAAEAAEGKKFDYVLIDCPPSLGLLTINALSLAREVIVPMQAHFLALQGLSKLLETVQLIQGAFNPGLQVSGMVLCMHDRQTILAQEVLADLEGFLDQTRGQEMPWSDAVVYQPPIRRNIKLAESPSFGSTIFDYAPDSNGAKDYLQLGYSVASQVVATDPVADADAGQGQGQVQGQAQGQAQVQAAGAA